MTFLHWALAVAAAAVFAAMAAAGRTGPGPAM